MDNKENKKLIIIIGVIAFLIAVLFISVNNKGIDYVKKVDEAFESSKKSVLYLARPTCGYCSLMTPIMDELSKTYNFTYEYINTDEVSSKQLADILKHFNKTTSEFGTPYTTVVEDGVVIAEQKGYTDEESMFNFFKNTGIISEDSIYEAPINYLTYEEYEQKIKSSEKQVFVVVQTGCSHCENVKPVFKSIKEKYSFTIDAINVSDLDEAQRNSFLSSLSYYSEKSWGTPLMLVVQNGQIISEKNGEDNETGYVEFLKANGFIAE